MNQFPSQPPPRACPGSAGEQAWQNLHNALERTASERDEARARVTELEADLLRFYHSDGTFEVLASPEEVVKRRVECAALIAELEARAEYLTECPDCEATGDPFPPMDEDGCCTACGADLSIAGLINNYKEAADLRG